MPARRRALALLLVLTLALPVGALLAVVPADGATRGVDGWVYFGRSGETSTQVWRQRPGDAGTAIQLTTVEEGGTPLAVSPDGRTVLWRRGPGELWRMAADGTDQTQVPMPGLTVGKASYTPDGRRLLLSAGAGSVQNLWTASPTGTGIRPIFTWDVAATLRPSNASWSPDGTRILFTGISSATGDREVMTIAPDGTGRRVLTARPGSDIRPDFSPDGRTIVWLSDAEGVATPYAMDADGTDERPAATTTGQIDDVGFTPSGQLLLRAWDAAVGGNEVRLTTLGGGMGTVVVAATAGAGISTAAVAPTPIQCDGRWATIVGGAGADTLRGSVGNDVIVGGGGADRIDGLSGDDVVCGGPGNDTIVGGTGVDRLFGQSGSDTLRARDSRRDSRIDCGSDKDPAALRDAGVDPAAVSCG